MNRTILKSLRNLSLATTFITAPALTQAAPYYQQAATTTNWTVPGDFNSQANGSGSVATTMTGNDFFVNGKVMGTSSGASTFTGNSLTVDNGSTLNLRNGGVKTVATLSTSGNSIITANNPSTTLSVTSFTASAGGITTFQDIQGVSATPSSQALSFTTLSGDGDFRLQATAGVNPGGSKAFVLSVVTGTAYTGDISWTGTNLISLQFGNDLILGGGLIATDSISRITLDRNITLASLNLNGSGLAAGTYTYAFLNANYDAIFNDGGSGSITVSPVPEPSTYAMILAGLGTLFYLRRRQAA